MNASLIGLVASAVLVSVSAWGAPANKPAVKASPAAAAAAASAAEAAAAEAQAAELTPGQFDAASRVLTGPITCEFGQIVQIEPVDGRPGYFKLVFKKITYTLVPNETTTGAVRLEDRKAGVVWVQIPSKSMLLNSKLGQRMVDSCLHSEQQSAVAPADSSLGIASAPLAPAAFPAPEVPASAAPALLR